MQQAVALWFLVGNRALFAGTVAVLLAGCGGAVSPTFSSTAAEAPQSERDSITSNLYVADYGLQAVVEFDSHGNKVGERKFRYQRPIDVVTDSYGNVYVMAKYSDQVTVVELSHDLSKQIALYTPTVGQAMTIDANDNLYVGGARVYSGISVYEYPYGSTHAKKKYSPCCGGAPYFVGGISVRGNYLYVVAYPVEYNTPDGPTVSACPLSGSKECTSKLLGGSFPHSTCGFTTIAHYSVYGDGRAIDTSHPLMSVSLRRTHRKRINLPTGYYMMSNCSLHNDGQYVWGGMMTAKGSQPAVALELDPVAKDIRATVGAGDLDEPTGAYYGNGFEP